MDKTPLFKSIADVSLPAYRIGQAMERLSNGKYLPFVITGIKLCKIKRKVNGATYPSTYHYWEYRGSVKSNDTWVPVSCDESLLREVAVPSLPPMTCNQFALLCDFYRFTTIDKSHHTATLPSDLNQLCLMLYISVKDTTTGEANNPDNYYITDSGMARVAFALKGVK